jgi:hypothetical protein
VPCRVFSVTTGLSWAKDIEEKTVLNIRKKVSDSPKYWVFMGKTALFIVIIIITLLTGIFKNQVYLKLKLDLNDTGKNRILLFFEGTKI